MSELAAGKRRRNVISKVFFLLHFYENSNEITTVKNWNLLGPLLPKINNPKIFIKFGKAKEDEGNFSEAASAYEKAGDYDNVIRILIDNLQDIEGGAALVRQTHARESAKTLALRYLQSRMYEPAVEFYLIAGMQAQALELAKQQNCVEFFASVIKDEASIDLCKLFYSCQRFSYCCNN